MLSVLEFVHNAAFQADWKVKKLRDLVADLEKIVTMQYLEIRKALHGMGEFSVSNVLLFNCLFEL